MYCCSIEDPGAIQTSWEHTEHRWIAAEEAETLFSAGYWLGELIRHAERIRAQLPPELLQTYREGLKT
jgi:hypothetical protein